MFAGEATQESMLDLEILYIRECPNYGALVELVEDVVRRRGLRAEVREREIRDETEAARERFRGSPTLRIDGRDLEPDEDGGGPYGLACRLYAGNGTPARERIEAALLDAARRGTG